MKPLTKSVLFLAAVTALTVLSIAPASAAWLPGDSCKMHFPQLPDPTGWDVEISSFTNQHECADDWRCSSTGPVEDIHFWYSVAGDGPTQIGSVVVTIYDDDRTGQFSKPSTARWTQTFDRSQFSVVQNYGSGLQGFADPQQPDTWVTGKDNHEKFHQINIENILDPFVQQEGTMYWLGIHVYWEGAQSPVGWKTARTQDHFEDYAVYRADTNGPWLPLTPQNGTPYPLDLAFVITPEPSTLVLLGIGAVSLLAYGWRRRRA